MVSDGTEFAVGDIEKLFEEARRNTKAKHKKWEKYYNRHRRNVQIKGYRAPQGARPTVWETLPYIEDRTRSSNKNARRGGDQQRQDQERRGACTKKSLSLKVLVGNANYKS
ncbi:hypothetical protein TNCV_4371301 [Trichonephila clavipes]|nr:hypothetical protein TNCV_4371301 [Trichonephila clavipes]